MTVLGIDIGGSGVKAAPIDPSSGTLVAKRRRIATPRPAEPEAVADVVAEIVADFGWTGAIGCTFPGVVKAGHIRTAANLEPAWIGQDADRVFTERTGCEFTLMNDADAAGLAEMRFGSGRDRTGVVLMLTLGTGIGSALFNDGRLVPNTELGHLPMRGKPAEHRAAARVRKAKQLTWEQYAALVNDYLELVETVLWPDLIIIGGGISAKADKWFHHLHARADVVPAQLANDAGIVGAALWVAERRSV